MGCMLRKWFKGKICGLLMSEGYSGPSESGWFQQKWPWSQGNLGNHYHDDHTSEVLSTEKPGAGQLDDLQNWLFLISTKNKYRKVSAAGRFIWDFRWLLLLGKLDHWVPRWQDCHALRSHFWLLLSLHFATLWWPAGCQDQASGSPVQSEKWASWGWQRCGAGPRRPQRGWPQPLRLPAGVSGHVKSSFPRVSLARFFLLPPRPLPPLPEHL
jgi:hypothetical protein